MKTLNSAVYTGWIRHRRFGPARNAFRYRIFMSYIDLAELPGLFAGRWLWWTRRAAPARFAREDFLAPTDIPLDTAVRNLVHQRTGRRPCGPIRLLTHLRFFGYSFNPVTFYYVYDEHDTGVETIVAEITNTPWKERHAYVLPVADAARAGRRAWRFRFDKEFHVSPFMPMDMRYEWTLGAPAAGLHVHMRNFLSKDGPGGAPCFDATLSLRREPMTAGSLARALCAFPFMTLQVVSLIHWQALKLWLKRTPFHVHPSRRAERAQSPT